MPIRTRSFSGKLLRSVRSKARLEEESMPVPDVPVPSLPPAVKLDASLHLPFGPSSSASSSPLPPPSKGLHRRSRSFSELLSIASSTTSHDQPWRSREAWAAVHSPRMGPSKKNKEGSVMDRSYGWLERNTERHQPSPLGLSEGERDNIGRQEFRFFHNSQIPPSAIDSDDESIYTPNSVRPQSHRRPLNNNNNNNNGNGRSRLNESTTRCSGDSSSSTISTMDLSLHPQTPPTSIDTDTDTHHAPHSATPSDESDLPLPPLLPELVKRSVSPPAFTRSTSPAPWAQRSPMKDIREASNLRWQSHSGSDDSDSTSSTTPPPPPPPARGARQVPKRQSHQRQRSNTLPSAFNPVSPVDARPESGLLPGSGPNPPRPARHPRRQPPGPVIIVEGETPMPSPPSTSNSGISPLSPRPRGPAAAAYYKPTMPLRSTKTAHQSLKPASRRPSTAPEARQVGFNPLPSPLPSATSARAARQGLTDASAARGGWI